MYHQKKGIRKAFCLMAILASCCIQGCSAEPDEEEDYSLSQCYELVDEEIPDLKADNIKDVFKDLVKSGGVYIEETDGTKIFLTVKENQRIELVDYYGMWMVLNTCDTSKACAVTYRDDPGYPAVQCSENSGHAVDLDLKNMLLQEITCGVGIIQLSDLDEAKVETDESAGTVTITYDRSVEIEDYYVNTTTVLELKDNQESSVQFSCQLHMDLHLPDEDQEKDESMQGTIYPAIPDWSGIQALIDQLDPSYGITL